MSHKLLTPYSLHDLSLKNHVIMAPMTRGRAENPELVPELMMVEYYRQRAGAGLIVSEAIAISQESIGYINTPGIYTPAQVAGWKKVVQAVHQEGGKIFAQLAHVGAVSHPEFMDGRLPLGPSAINPEEQTYISSGFTSTLVPREMTHEDIRRTVNDYRVASENAKAAGFDGVEIHGAHLYLIPEFLNSATNRRTDEYGGTPENRSRFVLEVIEATMSVWGPHRVGLKLSPTVSSGLMKPNTDSEPTYAYLAQKLNEFELAYLHSLRMPVPQGSKVSDALRDPARFFRGLYQGTLIAGGGYTSETGEKMLAEGVSDLVAYGVAFIANPDLVERFREGSELAKPIPDYFYSGGKKGYIDYPRLREAMVH